MLWIEQQKMQLAVWAMEFLGLKAEREQATIEVVKLVNELTEFYVNKMQATSSETATQLSGCECEHAQA